MTNGIFGVSEPCKLKNEKQLHAWKKKEKKNKYMRDKSIEQNLIRINDC